MVRTCAFLTISSPRSGSFPSDRPAARGEVVAARVAQPDSAIVPSAVAAPRNPRRLILIFIRPTPNPQRCGPLCCYIKDRHSSKLTNDKGAGGFLKLATPKSFGTFYLSDSTVSFSARYPNIQLSLILEDYSFRAYGVSSIRGLDIAVRLGDLPASNLIAHRLRRCDGWSAPRRNIWPSSDFWINLLEPVQQSLRIGGGKSRVHHQVAFGFRFHSEILRLHWIQDPGAKPKHERCREQPS